MTDNRPDLDRLTTDRIPTCAGVITVSDYIKGVIPAKAGIQAYPTNKPSCSVAPFVGFS
jgi:hypothetical protein